MTGDVRGRPKRGILDIEGCQLRDTHPCLDSHQQEGVVSAAVPAIQIDRAKNGVDFPFIEEFDQRTMGAFWWQARHTLSDRGAERLFKSNVLEEGVDCSESRIAGPRGIATLFLQVGEELADERGPEYPRP